MKLYCRKYGKGPPLVILHALYGSSDNWVSVAKAISSKYTVYLPDLRNHGLSPHSDVHDYNALSDDIDELVRELGTGKFFLAGHSMGGKTALFYAMKWPEKLEGLLIADISPFPSRGRRSREYKLHLNILRTINETDLRGTDSRNDIEDLISGKIPSERIRGFILKNLQRMPDGEFRWKINAPALLENLDKIMGGLPRPEGSYESISGFPVIFLKGENSDYLPDSDHSDILRIFPSAEFTTIRDAGHWLNADNPEAVISAFLALHDH